jgi:hypothetical protein
MEVMPLVILLEEHKRNRQVYNEIYGLIEEIEKKLKPLLSPSDAEE